MTDDELEEERFVKSYPQFCCNGKPLSPFWDLWEAGTEFAYNKVNEWHYVKDGDLPKDEEYKWCISRSGYPYIAKYEELFVSWRSQENKDVLCPYVWKDIVLPELKESE
jgi:hypothetical protein